MSGWIKSTGIYKFFQNAWRTFYGKRYAARVERDRKKLSLELFSEYFVGRPVIDLPMIKSPALEEFPVGDPVPWLDRDDAPSVIDARLRDGSLSEERARQAKQWIDDGVIIIPGLLDSAYLDQVWDGFELYVKEGNLELEYGLDKADPYFERVINPHHDIPVLDGFLKHPAMIELAEFFMGREAAPYQTILSPKGSNQLAHSDSVHMTTYPRGYLVAIWVAFEDIDPRSGPLEYYPGSHKLPYVSREMCGIPVDEYYKSGYTSYVKKYEPYIQSLIAEHGMEPAYFNARKGDALVWHANLLHGGKPREDISLSRKSVVAHYFASEALCYHDISGYYSGRFQEFADEYAEKLETIR